MSEVKSNKPRLWSHTSPFLMSQGSRSTLGGTKSLLQKSSDNGQSQGTLGKEAVNETGSSLIEIVLLLTDNLPGEAAEK